MEIRTPWFSEQEIFYRIRRPALGSSTEFLCLYSIVRTSGGALPTVANLQELALGADARLEIVQNLVNFVVGEVQLHVHADVVSEMFVVIVELERDLRGMHVGGEGRYWG